MSDGAARGVEGSLPALRAAVASVWLGRAEVLDLALTAMVAGGHLLLEDVPGVGKTTLAMALAAAMGGQFRRVQGTADLLPGDVTGVMVPSADGGLGFRPGPLFGHVVLADELNRTPPRTQSALLEAMAEGVVTVDGASMPLPAPFFVLATQNPHEHHGTWPLPDSQLDRFLIRVSLGYPDREAERAILRGEGLRPRWPAAVLDPAGVLALQREVEAVRVSPAVEDHVLDVVAATRAEPRLARGASPRAARALHRAARAWALVHGRRFVVPDDVRALAVPVLAHRVVVRPSIAATAGSGVAAASEIVASLVADLPAPG